MTDVLDRIQAMEHQLSRQHHLIAGVIRVRSNEAAMWNIQTLAREAGVSDATVLRFARTLGYSGFPEMKQALQRRVIDDLSSWRRVERTLTESPGELSVLQKFMEQQLQLLQEMVSVLPSLEVEQFAEELVRSRRIWIYGHGAAATPARALEFWLQRFGLQARVLEHSGRRLLDDVVEATGDDALVLLVFGFPSSDGTILIDWMRRAGARSLLVTDVSREAPETDADYVIRIARGPAGSFHSMALPVVLADTIALQCARVLGPKAVDAVRRLDEARKRYNIQ
jgi:DNA-binding MurR/RpiR family transcriptional regulator